MWKKIYYKELAFAIAGIGKSEMVETSVLLFRPFTDGIKLAQIIVNNPL